MQTLTYSVPGISCGHCRMAITRQLETVRGVDAIVVDLTAKTVTVDADPAVDQAIRRAIDDAGYEVA